MMDTQGVTDTAHVPLSAEMLPVGDGHELYVETVGRPDGVPAVFLHGGPGSGCQPAQRQLFDPDRFRAVFFDQRGAGRSTPRRSRNANTTAHLVADMERIRQHLGIARWLVVGGSWGATLALAYAETYPERVLGLALRSIFLGTRPELDWAFGTGLGTMRPDLYADFLAALPEAERAAPLEAYWRRILDADPEVHRPAARAWHDTEQVLSQVHPASARLIDPRLRAVNEPLPATPFMEAHYFAHDCFMAPGQLLANARRLAGIRGILVQGRYDLLCPPANAYALAAAWPEAELVIAEGAGHAVTEPGMAEALRTAIASFLEGGVETALTA